MTTELLERPTAETETDDPKVAHYVYPAWKLTEALVNGTAVTALCGHRWRPTRSGKDLPVCDECQRIRRDLGY